MRKFFTAISLLLVASGCAMPLTQSGSQVRVIDRQSDYNCKAITVVTGGHFATTNDASGAINDLRNKAAQAGANAVRIISIDFGKYGNTAVGEALDCSFSTSRERPVVATSQGSNASGFSRQEIREAQHLLNRLGHEAGTPDGLMGPKTVAAVTKFQRTSGMSATGILDTQTWDSLRLAASPEAQAQTFKPAPRNGANEVVRQQDDISGANASAIIAGRISYALVEIDLKASADPFSSTVTTIGKGREMTVLRDDGEWLHVRYDSREGYVFSEFVSR